MRATSMMTSTNMNILLSCLELEAFTIKHFLELAVPIWPFISKFVDVLLVVRMNGVVKTDESDSIAGDMPESAVSKPGQDSAVIQPPGIGPAIHLNGSACPVQEDQPVQVCIQM